MATAAPGTEPSSGVVSWKNSFKDSQAHRLSPERSFRSKGVVVSGEKGTPIGEGSVVSIAPNEHHNFINNSDEPLRFIYVLPLGT